MTPLIAALSLYAFLTTTFLYPLAISSLSDAPSSPARSQERGGGEAGAAASSDILLLPVLPRSAEVASQAQPATDYLYVVAAQSGQYRFAERKDAEKAGGALEDYHDDLKLAEAGKSVGTRLVLAPELLEVETHHDRAVATLEARVIHVESSTVIAQFKAQGAAQILGGAGSEALQREALRSAILNLYNDTIRFSQLSGRILSVQPGRVTVDQGATQGVRQGAEFTVWKRGRPVGRLGNCDLGPRLSRCEVVTQVPGVRILMGDGVSLYTNPSAPLSAVPKEQRKRTLQKWLVPVLVGAAVIAGVASLGKSDKGSTATTADTTSEISKVKVEGVTATPTKTVTGTSAIEVSWKPVSNTSVAGYYVYRASTPDANTTPSDSDFCLVKDTRGETGIPPWTDTGEDNCPARIRKHREGARQRRFLLTDGVTYWYRVAAVDVRGNSSQQSDVSQEAAAEAGATPPPSPPSLTSAKPGGSKVTLTWTPPSTRADGLPLDPNAELQGYTIFYSTDNGLTFPNQRFQSHDTTTTTQTLTLTGLTNDVTHLFKITALDFDNNESADSNTLKATPTLAPPPPAPTGVTAAASNKEVGITWTQDQDVIAQNFILQYKVYRSEDGIAFSLVGTVGTTSEATGTFSDTTVSNNIKYFYYVTAVNDEKTESSPSSTVSATPRDDLPPLRPENLEATGLNASVELKWDKGNLNKITHYYVYRDSTSTGVLTAAANSDTTKRIDTMRLDPDQVGDATKISYLDVTAANGTTYFYSVTAFDSKNGLESQPSNSAQATPSDVAPIAPPQWVGDGLLPGGDRITLQWSEVKDSRLAGYEIYRNTTSTPPTTPLAKLPSDGTGSTITYTDTTTDPNTEYFYFLKAFTKAGAKSEFSEARKAKPLITVQLMNPPHKTKIQGKDDGSASVKIAWGKTNLSGVKYVLQVGRIGQIQPADWDFCLAADKDVVVPGTVELSETFDETTTSTDFQPTGLPLGDHFYRYQVRAFNSQGVLVGISDQCGFQVNIPEAGTAGTAKPDPPKSVTISAIDRDNLTVKISWTAPDDKTAEGIPLPSTYRIYRTHDLVNPGFGAPVNEVSAKLSPLEVTDQVDIRVSRRWYYQVRSVDTEGNESTPALPTTLYPVEVYSGTAPTVASVETGGNCTASSGAKFCISAVGDGFVTLQWGPDNPADKDIRKYIVERGTDGTTFPVTVKTIGFSAGQSYSVTDIGVENGTTYFYRLVAQNFADVAPYPCDGTVTTVTCTGGNTGNEADAQTRGGAVKAKPVGGIVNDFGADLTLNIAVVGSGLSFEGAPKLTWSWATEPADLTGYQIFRAESSGSPDCSTNFVQINTTASCASQGGTCTYTDSTIHELANPPYNKDVCYRIVAFKTQPDGSTVTNQPSATVNVKPYTPQRPNAPQTVAVTASGNQQVSLSWAKSPEADVLGYWVFAVDRAPSGTAPKLDDFTCNTTIVNTNRLSADTVTFTHGGLTNNRNYYYRVAAQRYHPTEAPSTKAGMNAAACARLSDLSDQVIGFPQADPGPSAPKWVDEVDPTKAPIQWTGNGLTLQWDTPPSGTVSSYRVYRATGQNGTLNDDFTLLTTGGCANVAAPNLKCTDETATDTSTIYYYRLAAVNDQNVEGNFSTIRSGQPGSETLVLFTPEPGQTLRFTDPTDTVQVIFQWSPVKGAASYKVEVGNQASIDTADIYYTAIVDSEQPGIDKNIVIACMDGSLATQGCPTPPEFDPGWTVQQVPSTLYWRVKAFDNSGVTTQCSNGCLGQAFNITN